MAATRKGKLPARLQARIQAEQERDAARAPLAPDPVGADGARADLRGAIESGRPAHAWLLTGPPGVGKATFAVWAARLVLGGPEAAADRRHPVSLRVAAGTHPDLRALAPESPGGEIPVDAVRALVRALRLTAGEGGWRVAVIDSVCACTRQSANALLKIVEEPSPRTMFLLVCHRPGRVPATLASRCRRLHFSAPGPEDFARILRAARPEVGRGAVAALRRISEGSPGTAAALARRDGPALHRQVLEALAERPTRGEGLGPRAHALAARLEDREDEEIWPVFRLLAEGAVRRAVGLRVAGPEPGEDDGPLAAAEAALFADCPPGPLPEAAARFSSRLDRVERARLSKRHGALAAFSELAEVRPPSG